MGHIFLSVKKSTAKIATTMFISFRILWIYGAFLPARYSLGEWIEIAQPLSKPPPPLSETAPTTPTWETHATLATEKLEIPGNKSENADEELEDQVLAKEGDGFLTYLRNIQNTLTEHSRGNVDGKVSLLQNLRDNLLFNIREKIGELFNQSKEKRQARDYNDSDDYHMDFPSNEGALMTIGFLTFAVFLIKLVLKLIHSLKNKNNGANGTTTIMTTVGRKRREIMDEDALKILRWIEEYKFR